jgi:hypothetical protein
MVGSLETSDSHILDFGEVYEGMVIYDSDHTRIGMIGYIHFPDETVNLELSDEAMYLTSLYKLPENMRMRLARQGFILVDSGPLAAHQYVLPHQIMETFEDHIKLNCTKNALLEF